MTDTITPVALLAVLASPADRDALRRIIRHSRWTVRFAGDIREALAVLEEDAIGTVISDARISEGCSWKELLVEVERMVPAPVLIVTDRLADNCLWAEVLNLGAYDVLAQPFDAEEVFRVVSLAWQSWRSRVQRTQVRRRPAVSESKSGNVRLPFVDYG